MIDRRNDPYSTWERIAIVVLWCLFLYSYSGTQWVIVDWQNGFEILGAMLWTVVTSGFALYTATHAISVDRDRRFIREFLRRARELQAG